LLHLGSYLFVGFLFFRVFTHGLRMVFALGAYDSVTRLVCIGFGRMSTNSTTRTGISASGVFTCATFASALGILFAYSSFDIQSLELFASLSGWLQGFRT